ncbi:MAG: endonuclease [Bacteroidales bacterium]|nr:endonuclease [Bacteroidales bacterium]
MMRNQTLVLWNTTMNLKNKFSEKNRISLISRLIVFVCILLSVGFIGFSQQPDFVFMSYNVENLFDTIDNPYKNDDEYLPNAELKWNTYRYQKKLTDISKVIVAAGENWHNPDVVGLCEVENDTCLRDLIARTNLYKLHYKYIHYESKDARGIDVALLYNEETFVPVKHYPIRIQFDDNARNTRDVLYVKGIIKSTSDTVYIFQCHFPSRRGGKEESERFRLQVAETIRKKVDSLLLENQNSRIIIAGDFNDYPEDKSITEGLKAKKQSSDCEKCLVNLDDPTAEGTYKYQGKWDFLDQAIVSKGFLKNYNAEYHVVQNEFLLKKSEKTGETSPYRTYIGTIYKGGISDHLPIIVTFSQKK